MTRTQGLTLGAARETKNATDAILAAGLELPDRWIEYEIRIETKKSGHYFRPFMARNWRPEVRVGANHDTGASVHTAIDGQHTCNIKLSPKSTLWTTYDPITEITNLFYEPVIELCSGATRALSDGHPWLFALQTQLQQRFDSESEDTAVVAALRHYKGDPARRPFTENAPSCLQDAANETASHVLQSMLEKYCSKLLDLPRIRQGRMIPFRTKHLRSEPLLSAQVLDAALQRLHTALKENAYGSNETVVIDTVLDALGEAVNKRPEDVSTARWSAVLRDTVAGMADRFAANGGFAQVRIQGSSFVVGPTRENRDQFEVEVDLLRHYKMGGRWIPLDYRVKDDKHQPEWCLQVAGHLRASTGEWERRKLIWNTLEVPVHAITERDLENVADHAEFVEECVMKSEQSRNEGHHRTPVTAEQPPTTDISTGGRQGMRDRFYALQA